jgi:hypothetical protein
MILQCTFEELSVMSAAAERVLASAGAGGVAAPPQVISDIESLAPRLTGDIGVESLAEVHIIQRATRYLLDDARERTDALILEHYPAAESAVMAYFEYAHILTFLDRANRIGAQMTALIELMTGAPPTDESARAVSFPD